MSQTEPRRRMTGSDAMFLYFERKEMPLHIGSVAILDGPFDEESERVLAARLPELPRYRQRVVFPPLNLAHPTWEYDPEFDIRNHIRRVRLDPPGTEKQLSELTGRIFTPLMDRNRPLWDLTVVGGVEGGRSALILRVHHSLVDGVSGIGLVNLMFDPGKEPRRMEPSPYHPPPLPERGQLLVESMASLWATTASRLIGAQLTALRLVEAFAGDSSGASLRALSATMPELLRPTQPLPFNRPCSGVRGYCWTSFRFAEARSIRAALGGTINDVVMTTVAGAVSRYVSAHREPLENRFVRLLVPVNLRAGEDRGVGNEISMMPLSIPLDIPDPLQRMKAVTQRSSAMKAAHIAEMVALIGTWLGWTPPNLQSSLAALPFMPQPVLIVNLVCTNVPGPMIPLYANGHELLTYYPCVPCGGEVGIGVAISSYNRDLYFGVTYDAQAAPDGELFRDFLIESYEELREAAGVAAVPAPKPKPREPERASEPMASAEAPPAPEPAVMAAERVEAPAAGLSESPIIAPILEAERTTEPVPSEEALTAREPSVVVPATQRVETPAETAEEARSPKEALPSPEPAVAAAVTERAEAPASRPEMSESAGAEATLEQPQPLAEHPVDSGPLEEPAQPRGGRRVRHRKSAKARAGSR